MLGCIAVQERHMDNDNPGVIGIIYCIKCQVNNNCYVGSTTDYEDWFEKYGIRRLREHFNALRKGIHNSRQFQQDWNEYGEKEFKSKILEKIIVRSKFYTHKLEVLKRERHWQSELNAVYSDRTLH